MDFKENQAIYLQIANHFFENILQKKWNGGEKIPSIRDMAVEFEVNPNTTMRTFNYLLKKEQFVNEDLAEVFRNMHMLGISFEDLQKYYHQFIKNN
jgi:DNA-binding transcriptional regulator YhcF (GntR family)